MESLSHVLAPATQAYVAGGLATGAPRMLIWQLEGECLPHLDMCMYAVHS